MEQPLRYTIWFDGLEAGEAGQAAEDLQRTLLDEAPAVEARRVRTDPEAMDLGSVLEVVLAAPALLEMAKGITAWLKLRGSGEVTIKCPDGTVAVKNIGARQAVDLAERLWAACHGR